MFCFNFGKNSKLKITRVSSFSEDAKVAISPQRSRLRRDNSDQKRMTAASYQVDRMKEPFSSGIGVPSGVPVLQQLSHDTDRNLGWLVRSDRQTQRTKKLIGTLGVDSSFL